MASERIVPIARRKLLKWGRMTETPQFGIMAQDFTKRDTHMNHSAVLSAALASVMALGLAQPAAAHDPEMKGHEERCYGVAKAGQNSCANLTDTHGCAGMSTQDRDPSEWITVPKGSCAKMGGLSKAQAQSALAKAKPKAPPKDKGDVKGKATP
jgi:uncharacterized membrane protein